MLCFMKLSEDAGALCTDSAFSIWVRLKNEQKR